MAATTPGDGQRALGRVAAVAGGAGAVRSPRLADLAFAGLPLRSARDQEHSSVSHRIDVPPHGVTIPTAIGFVIGLWLAAPGAD